jgi:hypothetical protein
MQAYLGHRSINSTTRYAALAPWEVQEHLGEEVAKHGLRTHPRAGKSWKTWLFSLRNARAFTSGSYAGF